MKIEKLPYGSYRVRKMVNGKNITCIFDKKPTQKEVMEVISYKVASLPSVSAKYNLNFLQAYLGYIDLKSNILSPSTKRGYVSVINAIPEWFKELKVCDIDSIIVQKVINEYAAAHSPKTVSNMYGLISVILASYSPETHLKVQLPQKIKNNPYIPTIDEVKAIMEELKGTKYYIPTALGAMGMRKSEIIAITAADIGPDNSLLINKAIVKDENGNQVLKSTKTTESTRTIYLPDELADMIRKQGYAYRGFPDSITRNLKRVQNRLGIKNFPLHKMRHFFVTYAHNELHLSPEQIKNAGGWKHTSTIMETVYQHAMQEDEAKKKLAENLGSLF